MPLQNEKHYMHELSFLHLALRNSQFRETQKFEPLDCRLGWSEFAPFLDMERRHVGGICLASSKQLLIIG